MGADTRHLTPLNWRLLMPVKNWSISKQQPFTEEVTFNFDDHVNLFIGPNATGKSTLIRKLRADYPNQASVLVPASRLGLPFLHDDAGHQALVQGNEEGSELSTLLATNQYVFDAKRTLFVKHLMAREALRGSRSGEMLEQYFRALTLAYQCTKKICGEILADDPPETYIRNYDISVLVLQRQFREGCLGMHEGRRGASHGSGWHPRCVLASPPATAAVQRARTVPGAASPAPPGTPADG